MCDCKNVSFGTLGKPNQNRTAVFTCYGHLQEIDNCILEELQDLWDQGALTDSSCCGHNKTFAHIGVLDDWREFMKSRGYVEYKPGWFYPKSIPITSKFIYEQKKETL